MKRRSKKARLIPAIIFSALTICATPAFVGSLSALLELSNPDREKGVGNIFVTIFGELFMLPITVLAGAVLGIFVILAIIFWVIFAVTKVYDKPEKPE